MRPPASPTPSPKARPPDSASPTPSDERVTVSAEPAGAREALAERSSGWTLRRQERASAVTQRASDSLIDNECIIMTASPIYVGLDECVNILWGLMHVQFQVHEQSTQVPQHVSPSSARGL